MLAEPLPPAPRQPMSVQLKGVSDSKKPTRALRLISMGLAPDGMTYRGVGLPNVFRNSPFTSFLGDR